MAMQNERRLADGRVELIDTRRIEASSLYNEDLAPVPLSRRTWTTYNYAALWVSMAHCIPTYMLASGLMTAGMNWSQALVTILLGNTIVLIPILLNSHPGTKYGIPFPVFARAAYGTLRVQRAGVDARARRLRLVRHPGLDRRGSAADDVQDRSSRGGRRCSAPGFAGHTTTEWLSFLLFWGLNIFIIYRGMDLLREVENWAAPFVLVMTGALLWWAVSQAERPRAAARAAGQVPHPPRIPPGVRAVADGDDRLLGDALAQHARLHPLRPQPARADHRPGRGAADDDVAVRGDGRDDHQRDGDHLRRIDLGSGAAGRTLQLADRRRRSRCSPSWSPRSRSTSRPTSCRRPTTSPTRFRKYISFKTGGLITGLLGIAIQPWRLLADPSGYIYTWLLGYSGGLGSIAGVLIVDYWIVRRRELSLEDLYLADGIYRGWNWRAIAATAIGCGLAWGGLVVPALKPLYDYAWFVGFFVSAVVHLALAPSANVGRRPAAVA